MNVSRDIVEVLAEGDVAVYQSNVIRHNSGFNEKGRIERLCHESGGRIDNYTSNGIEFYFKGPDGERSTLYVQNGDSSLVTFFILSALTLDKRSPRLPELMKYLLQRNIGHGGIGKWGMGINDNGGVFFYVMYQALGSSLDGSGFKFICESLVREGYDFDAKLIEQGWNR